jgi:hypothetical protein
VSHWVSFSCEVEDDVLVEDSELSSIPREGALFLGEG